MGEALSLRELIERTGNLMRYPENRRIVSFLLKVRATTRVEIETKLGLETTSISKKLSTLRSLGFIEKKGRIGAPYKTRRARGAGVPIWGILKTDPQDYVNAQRRYGEIILSTENTSSVRQCQMPEAIALAKTYMDDRGLRTIPDSRILTPMLEEKGINVAYNQLLTAMVKEGYSL